MALQALRKHSKGWVAGLLFFVLILAFAAWGIEDMLRQGFNRSGPVITVGREEVGQREFETAYRRLVGRLQEQLKRQFDYETIKGIGQIDALVRRLTLERFFVQEARDKGVLVSDRVIQQQILADATFRGIDGRFDRGVFARTIEAAGLNEPTYIALLKAETARNFLIGSVATVEHAPAALADRLFAHRNEYRAADVLTVPATTAKPAEPTAEQLAAFHKANPGKYTAPEYRKITLLLVRPEDGASRVPVTDKDIEAEYERRKAEFTTPETRALRQILARDEATAKQVYEALIAGRTFETAAKEIAKSDPIDLGKVTKEQLPIPELGEAAWKLKQGEVSPPVKSPLAWHIVKVEDIVPMAVKPMAEVRDQLEKGFRDRGGVRVLVGLREQFDDQVGGGGKIESAADKLKLKTVTIDAVDAQGKDEKGEAVAGLPDDPEFLRRIFRQGRGEQSDAVDLKNGGFYAVRIDEVKASALRPVETVKDQVAADWKADEVKRLTKVEAERILAEAKAGKPLADLAKDKDYTVRKSKPINRGEGASAGAGSLEERIFSVKPGEVALAETKDGFAVIKVEAATDERSEADLKKAREEFLKSFKQTYAGDITHEYVYQYLESRYPSKVDMKAIDQMLGGKKTE